MVTSSQRSFCLRYFAKHVGFMQGICSSYFIMPLRVLTCIFQKKERSDFLVLMLVIQYSQFNIFRPEGNDRYVMFAPDNPKKV